MEKESTLSKIAYALLALTVFIWAFLYLLNNNATLFAGLLAGLIPSLFSFYLHRQNQEKEHRNWLLRNKDAVLIEFIEMMFSMISPDTKLDKKALKKWQSQLNTASFMYSSSTMMKLSWEILLSCEYEAILAGKFDEDDQVKQNMVKFLERILRCARKELGHDDSNLPPGFLTLMLFFHRQDEMEKVKRSEKLELEKEILNFCEGENYDDIYSS